MLNFDTAVTKDSLLFEGVTFTVRVLNSIERAKRDAPLLATRARLTEIGNAVRALEETGTEYDPVKAIDEAGNATESPALKEHSVEWLRLNSEYNTLNEQVMIPAYILAGFVGAAGFTINNQAPTPANILSARTPMLAEIYTHCEQAAELDAVTSKNSQSSTTSAEAADGRTGIMIVSSANETNSTPSATAARSTAA